VTRGELLIAKELSPDFTLAVKHHGEFTAILDRLVTRFPVFAVVRNPLATLASWSSIDHPIHRGHLPLAERFDRSLRQELRRIDDDIDRQFRLLSWFHERLRCYLPEEVILRYEEIVATGGKALAVIQPAAVSLDQPLQNQNTSPVYDRERILRIGERLTQSDGAYWQSYSRSSVERLLNELTLAVPS